ncbi:PAS domain S-box protein [bacterium]|nr:PAS domain S-box protein [bacterium]
MNKKRKDSQQMQKLREQAENLRDVNKENIPNMSPDEVANLFHEYRIYQKELEIQNDQLREMEQELSQSREKYAQLYDFAPVGYLTICEEGVILQANLTFAGMVEVERTRLIQRAFSDFIVDEDQDVFYLCRRKCLDTQMQQNGELRIKNDHDWFWVWLDLKPIGPGQEDTFRLALTLTNITQRKQAEEKIRQSEQKYRRLFEDALDMIHIVNQDGFFIDANDSLLNTLDFSKSDYSGMHFLDIVHMDYREATRPYLYKVLHGETVTQMETCLAAKDGREINVELNSVPQMERGKVKSVRTIMRDITQRKALAKEVQKNHIRLHALTGRLFTVRDEEQHRIARELHDQLGQDITLIKMGLDRLSKEMPEACEEKLLPPLEEQVQNLIEMTDHTVKRVRRICSELRPTTLDNLGFIPTIETDLNDLKEKTGIQYTLEAESTVNLDARRRTILYRIFQEALTNIMRYAEATEVKVYILEKEDNVVMEIIDNGRGITEEEIKESSSLGLLGIQERAAILGGQADIQGNPGTGTIVRVTVPLKETQKEE